MAGEESSEALQQAREALRKLHQDVATFQSPAVRRQLQARQQTSSLSDGGTETTEELRATIISMRTQLHDAGEAQKRIESSLFESSKRAAKSEAEVRELKQQLKDKNTQHDEVVKAASERIEALEKESKEAVDAARNKSYRLQEALDKDRLGSTAVLAERDRFRSEVKAASSRAAALERELEAANERYRVESRRISREKVSLEAKNVALQEEVNHLKDSLRSESWTRSDTPERRSYVQDLRNEASRLREEVAERDSNAVSMKKQLIDAESAVFQLNRELEDAKRELKDHDALLAEVESLRAQRKKFSALSSHVSALVREKEELTLLVARLSKSGDVQEGLKILKDAAGSGSIPGSKRTTPLTQDMESLRISHEAETSEHARVVAHLKRKCADYEAKLKEAIMQKEQAIAANKRSETIRRILEHEKTFFKAALEKIESEFDKVGQPSSEMARLQERCDAYERSAREYETAMKDMERNFKDSQKQIELLNAKLAATRKPQSPLVHDGDVDHLKAMLSKAEKNMREAIVARDAANDNAREVSTRMATVEQELQKLKLSRDSSSDATPAAEELDYDPAVSRVVHMRDNPLSQAMQRAAAEREAAKGKKRMRMDVGEASPRVHATNETIQALRKNIEELEAEKAELSSKYKVGVRTVEIAKKRIEEVRSAVYNLFGWSMKIIGAKYTISSIYAEAPGDDLEFGRNEEGTMALIETEYTKRLTEELDHYVQKMNSIPALLAHITMENFEKTTAFV